MVYHLWSKAFGSMLKSSLKKVKITTLLDNLFFKTYWHFLIQFLDIQESRGQGKNDYEHFDPLTLTENKV